MTKNMLIERETIKKLAEFINSQFFMMLTKQGEKGSRSFFLILL